MLLARPVSCTGRRAWREPSRPLCAASHFSRLAGKRGYVAKIYGKLRWFCCGARELVIAGPPRGQDSNTSGTALILLPLPERFRNWERDRLGRSGRRPAGQPHPSHHLVASSIRKGFRPEAENRERDAPAPRKQLNRSGPGRNIWRTVLALRTSVRQIQSCVFPPRGVKFSTLMQACAPLCTIKNAWPGVLPQAGRVGEH